MKTLATFSLILFSSSIYAQVISGNGYLVGDYIEVGVDGSGGFEGADTTMGAPAGLHTRNGGFSSLHGFVADPQMSSWTSYNGDFFTPGSPENGWGLEIGGSSGTSYSNNGALFGVDGIPGSIVNYVNLSGCQALDWEGITSGGELSIGIRYTLMQSDLYYTNEVTVTNTSGAPLDSIFYYRNVDPDNNQVLSGDYATQNTINNQPVPGCEKALVTARHTLPYNSYVGLGAVGMNFRVCYGGFSNRDGSDIWYGAGLLESGLGSTASADQSMSLGYLIEHLEPGESARFKFVVVLSASQIDVALASLFDIAFNDAIGSAFVPACTGGIDTLVVCGSNPVDIELSSNGINDFTWAWSPGTNLSTTTGPVTTFTPGTDQGYTVTGTPISGCYSVSIVKDFFVKVGVGPDLDWTDPGSQCGSFDLDDLIVTDLNGLPSTIITYHSSPPDSANDMSNQLPSSVLSEGDSAWVMISSPTGGGCYDFELVTLTWDTLDISLDALTDVSCAGAMDGAFDVSGLGGTTPYTFDIGTGGQPSGSFTGLGGGSYNVVITDASGCADSLTAVLTDPAPISTTASTTPESTGFDGAINITVSGGAGGYLFDWDLDGTGDFDDPEDIAGLASGFYTVTIMDANGCIATISVFVSGPSGIADYANELNLVVSPNPATDYVTIDVELTDAANLQIINALGQVVSELTITNARTQVDVSVLERGTYLFRIISNGKSGVVRVVKD